MIVDITISRSSFSRVQCVTDVSILAVGVIDLVYCFLSKSLSGYVGALLGIHGKVNYNCFILKVGNNFLIEW